ncbi:3'(2'),5'-bisphosphate nucleotidase CysQ [Devosia sp.]|uniref:3'(2'),5'-bisphosphate nucleotidase CysQ n=1 Tax=Devosia sp. TaxID=1871048 RepID=UPI003A94D73B
MTALPDHAALASIMNTAAIAAGEAILTIYNEGTVAESKLDGSPVTEADRRGEEVILAALAETGIPVLAEESCAAGHVPELGQSFFVVDPLDGTKEFLKRNGEFTVNIAYCENGRPVRGVVLAPATGEIFWGGPDGAFTGMVVGGEITQVSALMVQTTGPLKIVASRSHGHAALSVLCASMGVADDVSVGSSLKFCLVAKGAAQLYPRFTPTCEWDTAAGQAVLEAAGGIVLGLDDLPLTCGHPDRNFLNGFFVAAANRDLALSASAEMRRALG